MKTLVFAFLLLLGVGAQPALACVEDAAGGHHARAVVTEKGLRPAIEFDRVASEHQCDCPARVDGAQAAVTGSEKFLNDLPAETSASFAGPSYAEMRRVLDARSRLHSDASPASHLPPYLLTARLRC